MPLSLGYSTFFARSRTLPHWNANFVLYNFSLLLFVAFDCQQLLDEMEGRMALLVLTLQIYVTFLTQPLAGGSLLRREEKSCKNVCLSRLLWKGGKWCCSFLYLSLLSWGKKIEIWAPKIEIWKEKWLEWDYDLRKHRSDKCIKTK